MEALDRDRLICWSEAQSELPPGRCVERLLAGRAPALTVTSLVAQVSAARAGLGLAVLPHFLALDAGLSRVPVPLDLSQPIWLVLHTDLRRSMRVRVVADHMAAVVRGERARLEGGPGAARADR